MSHCVRGIKGEAININKLEEFDARYMIDDNRYAEFMKNIQEGTSKKDINDNINKTSVIN